MKITQRHHLIWITFLVLFVGLLFLLREMLLPFVVGLMIAYFLDPVVDALERRRWSRQLATLMVLGVFFGIGCIALLLMAPVIYRQLLEFVEALPALIENIRLLAERQVNGVMEQLRPQDIEQIKQAVGEQSTGVFRVFLTLLQGMWNSGMAFVGLLSLLFVTPLVAFYCLRDWDVMMAHFNTLLPRRYAADIREQCRQIDRVIAGFLRGQMLVCMILAAYYCVTLSLIGVKYALLIGLAAGLLAFIPYIGTFAGLLAASAVAYMQFGDWPHVAMVAGVFATAQFFEGNFITPKIVGDRVGLHPAWIIFGMLAGGSLLGFVGILIAVPLTAVIGVLVRFAVARYLESDLYQSGASQPGGSTAPTTKRRKTERLASRKLSVRKGAKA